MAAKLEDSVLDGGLTILNTAGSRVYICADEPTSFAIAEAGLGMRDLGAGNVFGVPTVSTSPAGQKVTSVAISGGSVTSSGTAAWWAVTSGTVLYAHGQLSAPVAVTSGQTFVMTPIVITLPTSAGAYARILDNGLAALVAEADRLFLCSSTPATYAGITAVKVGEKIGVRGAMFSAIAANSPDGRKTSLNSIVNGDITASGTAVCAVIADSTTQRLLHVSAFASSQTVVAGRKFSLGSFPIAFVASTSSSVVSIGVARREIAFSTTSPTVVRTNVVTSGLPAGVTLRPIDGELLTSPAVQTHNYFSRNNYTYAAAFPTNLPGGWDSLLFVPVGSFLGGLSSGTVSYWNELGWNMCIPDGTTQPLVARSNNISIIMEATTYATYPGDIGSETVGWLAGDEPADYATAIAPIQSIPNAFQDNRFWHIGFQHQQMEGELPGTPAGMWDYAAILLTPVATPNATTRVFGTTANDLYFFAGGASNGDFWMQVVGGHYSTGTLTRGEMRRGFLYGEYIDMQRAMIGTTANGACVMPIYGYVETGSPYAEDTDADIITPTEINQAVWCNIIHGARGIIWFDKSGAGIGAGGTHSWYDIFGAEISFAQTLQPGETISRWDALVKVGADMKLYAPQINAPFALGYATVSPAKTSFPFTQQYPPGGLSDKQAIFNGGIDMCTKWDGNNFYIFATPRTVRTATNIAATFTIVNTGATQVTVLGESRTIPITNGGTQFVDTFATGLTVHLYRIGSGIPFATAQLQLSTTAPTRAVTNVTAGGFPNESNTGPRFGGLTPSGTITSTSNGQVISGMFVTGSIDVVHDNVIVEDCEVDCSGTNGINAFASNCTVRYCKVYGRGGPPGPYDPYNQSPYSEHDTYHANGIGVLDSISSPSFEVHNCNIYGVENALSGGDDCYFHDNYIHDFAIWFWAGDPDHTDGLQTFGFAGRGGLRMEHNTIIALCTMGTQTPDTPATGSSCIALSADMHDLQIVNNYLYGGSAQIYGNAQPQGGATGSSINTVITGNKLSNLYTAFDGFRNDSGFVWSNNTEIETGALIPGP